MVTFASVIDSLASSTVDLSSPTMWAKHSNLIAKPNPIIIFF